MNLKNTLNNNNKKNNFLQYFKKENFTRFFITFSLARWPQRLYGVNASNNINFSHIFTIFFLFTPFFLLFVGFSYLAGEWVGLLSTTGRIF